MCHIYMPYIIADAGPYGLEKDPRVREAAEPQGTMPRALDPAELAEQEKRVEREKILREVQCDAGFC